MSNMVEIDNAGLTKIILWTYPVIIGQGIIVLESLRILPAEFRVWRRALKRRRFNAAEIMFLVIKYFAIVGYCLDIVFRTTTWLTTGRQCYIAHYLSTFFILFDTTLVALAIAWRTYIIFQCNRKIYWILSLALAGQLALSMWTMTRVTKVNVVIDGYCDAHYPDSKYEIPTMKLALPYYLLYNALYDLLVTAAATRHLIKSTGASFGVSEISRVLFYNNIHYVLVVCTVNLAEAFLLFGAHDKVPSLMNISCAVQIITAMNLLVIEQDLVHRPATTRVSHAPNSGSKSDQSNSSTSLAKLAFSSPSTATSHSWQTNSKQQTATFQSELSSVGSPLLHSLWHKKAKEAKKHQQQGISFEQKKMHFYDDYMSDLEKQEYSPGLSTSNGSPRPEQGGQSGNTFIIANPDSPDGPRVYQMSQDSNNMMMTSSPPYVNQKAMSPPDLESTYTDYIAVDPQLSTTSAGGATGGISIRSIRANMETSSVDGAMNGSPVKHFHRPTTSPITPLSQAKKRVSRMFDTFPQQPSPPSFEISPGKGVKVCPRAMVDPANLATTSPQLEETLHHAMSKASMSSVTTKASFATSQTALRLPTPHQTQVPTAPRHRSNNLSTATLDREVSSCSIDNDAMTRSDHSGEGGHSNMTFGRKARTRRLSSLEMDDDPFRS